MGLAFLWLPSPPLFPLPLCHSGNVTLLVRRVSIPWAPLSEASCCFLGSGLRPEEGDAASGCTASPGRG